MIPEATVLEIVPTNENQSLALTEQEYERIKDAEKAQEFYRALQEMGLTLEIDPYLLLKVH